MAAQAHGLQGLTIMALNGSGFLAIWHDIKAEAELEFLSLDYPDEHRHRPVQPRLKSGCVFATLQSGNHERR